MFNEMSTLWHIYPPDLGKHEPIWIHGIAHYRCQVPGADCPNCGPGASGRVHLFHCPLLIAQEIEEVYSQCGCLPWNEFLRYKGRWQAALKETGIDAEIKPGDTFLPLEWKVPTRAKLSLFWPGLAIVVGRELCLRLQTNAISGIVVDPVAVRSVGILDATFPIPQWLNTQCAEPEELVEFAPKTEVAIGDTSYFSLHTIANSYHKWLEEVSNRIEICALCDRRKVPRSVEIEMSINRSQYRKRCILPFKYTFPVDVFQSHIYDSGIIVNDRTFNMLNENDLRNCEYRQIAVVSSTDRA